MNVSLMCVLLECLVPVLRNPKAATLKFAVTTMMFPTAARYEPSSNLEPALWKNTRTEVGCFYNVHKNTEHGKIQ